MQMKTIPVTEIENVKIGQFEDRDSATGCTVFVFQEGAAAGLDVRGGGPASRESELLNPVAAASQIHAIVLSGGSAFGLDAAGGVMQYLEEQKIGLDVGTTRVPLVCQSSLFDLTVARSDIRPDKKMGYEACRLAFAGNYRDGSYGAGTGATVGKLKGMDYCMKSGIGSYAVQIGELKVGAVAAVNAMGDIYDTNAEFRKSELCKIAGMGHDGYARAVRPVHLSVDGDSIYAVSTGSVSADQDMVGALAARVMAEAVLQAVFRTESAYGYPAARDLEGGSDFMERRIGR